MHCYLENLLNYCFIGKDDSYLYHFAYIAMRYLTEIEIIELIKPNVPIDYLGIHSALSVDDMDLEEEEIKFIHFYKVREVVNQKYLEKTLEFFNGKFEFQKSYKDKAQKIIQCKKGINDLHDRDQKIQETIEKLNKEIS